MPPQSGNPNQSQEEKPEQDTHEASVPKAQVKNLEPDRSVRTAFIAGMLVSALSIMLVLQRDAISRYFGNLLFEPDPLSEEVSLESLLDYELPVGAPYARRMKLKNPDPFVGFTVVNEPGGYFGAKALEWQYGSQCQIAGHKVLPIGVLDNEVLVMVVEKPRGWSSGGMYCPVEAIYTMKRGTYLRLLTEERAHQLRLQTIRNVIDVGSVCYPEEA